MKGFTSLEMEHAYLRAKESGKQVGETVQFFPALFGLWVFYLARAGLRKPQELAEQLLHIARSAQDQAFLSMAHHTLGQTLFFE